MTSARRKSARALWIVIFQFGVSLYCSSYANASTPFCGLYTLYAALQLMHSDANPDVIFRSEFVSTESGSSTQDLLRAANNAGIDAIVLDRTSISVLKSIKGPTIVHVKASVVAESYSHWMLLIPDDHSRDALVYDPPEGPMRISWSAFSARWDGTAIVVGAGPDEHGRLVRRSQLEVAGYVGVFLAVICAGKAAARIQGAGSKIIGRASVQVAVIVITSSVVAGMQIVYRPETTSSEQSMIDVIACRQLTLFRSADLGDIGMTAAGRPVTIIDARLKADFDAGHIDGAMNIPVISDPRAIARTVENLPKDAPIVVYCQSAGCPYARQVALHLVALGFRNLAIYREGWVGWKEAMKNAS